MILKQQAMNWVIKLVLAVILVITTVSLSFFQGKVTDRKKSKIEIIDSNTNMDSLCQKCSYKSIENLYVYDVEINCDFVKKVNNLNLEFKNNKPYDSFDLLSNLSVERLFIRSKSIYELSISDFITEYSKLEHLSIESNNINFSDLYEYWELKSLSIVNDSLINIPAKIIDKITLKKLSIDSKKGISLQENFIDYQVDYLQINITDNESNFTLLEKNKNIKGIVFLNIDKISNFSISDSLEYCYFKHQTLDFTDSLRNVYPNVMFGMLK